MRSSPTIPKTSMWPAKSCSSTPSYSTVWTRNGSRRGRASTGSGAVAAAVAVAVAVAGAGADEGAGGEPADTAALAGVAAAPMRPAPPIAAAAPDRSRFRLCKGGKGVLREDA
jgi:hypothetical protein